MQSHRYGIEFHTLIASFEVLPEVVGEGDVEACLVLGVGKAPAEVRDADDHGGVVPGDAMDLAHDRERVRQMFQAVVALHMVEVVVRERIGEGAQVVLDVRHGHAVQVHVHEPGLGEIAATEIELLHARPTGSFRSAVFSDRRML